MEQIPLPTDADAITRTLMDVLSEQRESQLFALVEGALFQTLPEHNRRRWSAQRGKSMLTRAGAGAHDVGPLPFDLTAAHLDAKLAALLLDLPSGRIAGSFLVTASEPSELARRNSASAT